MDEFLNMTRAVSWREIPTRTSSSLRTDYERLSRYFSCEKTRYAGRGGPTHTAAYCDEPGTDGYCSARYRNRPDLFLYCRCPATEKRLSVYIATSRCFESAI